MARRVSRIGRQEGFADRDSLNHHAIWLAKAVPPIDEELLVGDGPRFQVKVVAKDLHGDRVIHIHWVLLVRHQFRAAGEEGGGHLCGAAH